jgi:membrane protein required for colicin V production
MENLSVTATDIVILIVLLLSAFLAYFRGFVREVLSLGTWAGAGLAAYFGFRHVSPYAREYITSGAVADIATGVGLFLGALVLLTFVNHAISKRVKDSALSTVDRALGLLFGAARGALIICVAYIAATWFWVEKDLPEFVTEARALPVVRDGAGLIIDWLPEDIQKNIQQATKDAAEKSEQVMQAEQLLRGLNEKTGGKTNETPNDTTTESSKAPTSAYTGKERRELQRFINGNQ